MIRLPILLLSILLVLPSIARAGVTLVKDVWPEGWGTQPMDLTVVNDVLYFTAYNSEFGRELWRSDGTTAGTTLVKDINPGPNEGFPQRITASGGKLFFVAYDGPSYEGELWVSDGTDAGTQKLDINPAGSSNPDWLTDVNGIVYCAATHATFGRELWKSDGTIGGTVRVTDGNPLGITDPTELTAVGNLLYFAATAVLIPGNQTYVSNGTAIGTTPLGGGSSPHEFTSAGSRVFFVAATGVNWELYSTNGTPGGTAMVKKLNPSGSSDARDLGAFGSILLFSANDGVNGNELWRSDGTADGTYMVKNLNTAPVAYPDVGYAWPRGFMTLGSVSLFSAREPATGRELWATNGTEAGTLIADDIIPGSSGWLEPRFMLFQGQIYFDYDDGVHGSELWKTDGTSDGTMLVSDLIPGPMGSVPQYLTVMDNALYFAAYDDVIGDALWRYDPPPLTDVSDRVLGDVLLQNTPNPFNPTTRIAFELGQREHVTLSVYDVHGALIRTLVDRTLPSGRHEQEWNGRDNEGGELASGVYFIKLRTADATLVRKATLLK